MSVYNIIVGTLITKIIGHRLVILFSCLTYLVQLLYLGKWHAENKYTSACKTQRQEHKSSNQKMKSFTVWPLNNGVRTFLCDVHNIFKQQSYQLCRLCYVIMYHMLSK